MQAIIAARTADSYCTPQTRFSEGAQPCLQALLSFDDRNTGNRRRDASVIDE
jgi:hypothetical protein